MAKFHKIAHDIEQQILNGVWRSGDKIPSVRSSAKRYQTSLTTTLQAYQWLESHGLVRSKPQSGYFVNSQLEFDPKLTAFNEFSSHKVAINDQLFDFIQQGKDPKLEQFAPALPDPSLFPHRDLAKSLANASKTITDKSVVLHMPPGNESLRRMISQRYQRCGVDVNPDEIVITSGAMEALNLSLAALTKPGDLVAIESPTFYGALQAIEKLNLKAVEIPTDPKTGIDISAFQQACQELPIKVAWLMPNMQNPTGVTLSDEKKSLLAQIAETNDVALVEDDVYSELYDGEQKPKPLRAFLHKKSLSLLCGSFSKCLSPGFRVGWVVASKHHLAIQKLQLMLTLSSSMPTQMGIADYLTYQNYELHLKKLRTILAERKHLHTKAIIELFPRELFSLQQHVGGYFVWVQLSNKINADLLYRDCLSHQIAIAPGSLFSVDRQHNNAIRLNTSHELTSDRLSALATLGKLIKKHCSS